MLKDLIQQASKLAPHDREGLQKLKNRFSAGSDGSPSNIELIRAYRDMVKNREMSESPTLLKLLRKKAIRSLSGIASITIITKWHPCQGKCIYCPTEPGMPKSYLSNEPAIMRAILNDFDAHRQTKNRLMSLEKEGHPTDKIEVIVSGGTWSNYPVHYQTAFTRNMYNALNNKKSGSLALAQKINETALHRCVGLSFETRPDCINEKELKRLRMLGATKVEMGIQCLDDHINEINQRGHSVEQVKDAMKLIKDAGFKVNVHMMPNLYGSNLEKDYQMFVELFENPAFRPDWMKIYPCLVVPFSVLEHMWKRGMHKVYTDEELVDLLVRVQTILPEYVRITRLYRDIPMESVLAGSTMSNLRQVVEKEMAKRGVKCRCIRCREIRDEIIDPEKLVLNVKEFDSSDGKEFFLSWDDMEKDRLCAFLRLRFPSQIFSGKKHFIPELRGAAIVRELHTYGFHVPIDRDSNGAVQHLGLGKKLMQKAEEITRAAGIKRLAVISGIGVREYYRKLGYKLEGTYMVKKLIQ